MMRVKNKKISLEDLHKEIDKLRIELVAVIKDVIEAMDKKFLLMDNKIGGFEKNVTYQIQGLANRIDDLADNRVKYSDFDKLRADLELIRQKADSRESRK